MKYLFTLGQLRRLENFIDDYHRLNNQLLNKIDDLIPIIKQGYNNGIAVSGIKNYEDYLQKTLFDPYGNKLCLDLKNFEIYFENYEVYFNDNEIIDWIKNKDRIKSLTFKVNIMKSRVKYDLDFLVHKISDYYKKNRKLPNDLSRLEIKEPYQKFGNTYTFSKDNYEVSCNGNYILKKPILDELFEIDKSELEGIFLSYFLKNHKLPNNVAEFGDEWFKDPISDLYEIDTISCHVKSTKGSKFSFDYFLSIYSSTGYANVLNEAIDNFYEKYKKMPNNLSDLSISKPQPALNKYIEFRNKEKEFQILFVCSKEVNILQESK